jgi:hypothetical protein
VRGRSHLLKKTSFLLSKKYHLEIQPTEENVDLDSVGVPGKIAHSEQVSLPTILQSEFHVYTLVRYYLNLSRKTFVITGISNRSRRLFIVNPFVLEIDAEDRSVPTVLQINDHFARPNTALPINVRMTHTTPENNLRHYRDTTMNLYLRATNKFIHMMRSIR